MCGASEEDFATDFGGGFIDIVCYILYKTTAEDCLIDLGCTIYCK